PLVECRPERPAFGTFAPFSRASFRPIAIACLPLFTVPPLPPFPLFSLPLFIRCIALFTVLLLLLPYRAMISSFARGPTRCRPVCPGRRATAPAASLPDTATPH